METFQNSRVVIHAHPHPNLEVHRAATPAAALPSQLSHRLSERLDQLQTRTSSAGMDIAR